MAKLDKRADQRRRKKMRQYYLVAGALGVVALLLVAAWALSPQATGPPSTEGRQCATIVTPHGDIVAVLYTNLVPQTGARFASLFQGGYYNALAWTRGPPEEDWVLQAGQGGSSRDPIPLEINPSVKNVRGSLGAARTNDPDSATTQFYILKRDSPHLDAGYSVFGTVISGMAAVDQILKNETITRTSLADCP